MKKASLLVIEARHSEHPAFTLPLQKKGFEVRHVTNGSEALAALDGDLVPDVVVINAATLRSSGKRICQSLREKAATLPVLVILSPERDGEILEANTILSLPFTPQKLFNRIRHLLPPEGKNTLHAGSIRLNPETGVVRCAGKQSRLTPRLVRLLTILVKNRGEVVERKLLFSQTWETDYTDDTRTLDVHISWLRQAIEANPQKPKLIKTVRGVGYRLDI